MQGWRKRMEDSHISEMNIGNGKTSVFGVFDGHGGIKNLILGKEVAIYVKKHFCQELLNNSSYKQGNIKNAGIENFLKMDEIMVESAGKLELRNEAKLSKEDDEKNSEKNEKNKQMDMYRQLFDPRTKEDCDIAMNTGCTACVCIIEGDKIYCVNAGDSRAVLCKNGVAYPLSIDHKPDLDSEKNRIYKAEGWVTDGRVKGIYYIIQAT